MEFRLLGPLEVVDDEGRVVELPAGKPRALLALLLLETRQVVSVDRIVDALWGERPPATAEAVVQGYASRLRKLLPEGALARRGQAYVLHVDEGELDLERFERLRRDGIAAAEGRCWQQAATLLEAALALWRGPPLAEFEDESFARDETARLRELRLVVLQQRLEADLALGGAAKVVPELKALVRDEPLRERLHELLMLALYRAGRQADALAAYQDARAALREQLGLEPSPALQRLERAILVHDPALQLERERLLAPALGQRVPLPGPLVPAARFAFVGRAEELAALRVSLRRAKELEGSFALLAGEAGAGKTRLVREFAHEAAADGVLVCYGVSDAAVSTPYQPLLEWLEFLLRVSDPDALRECLAGAGEALIALMPELSRFTGARTAAESDADRVQIQRGATELLTRLSRVQPLLLVADDIHWADGETLHLLRRLARIAPEVRLVVLAAYRDRGEPLAAAFTDTLTDLSRLDAVTRIGLGNLSASEVSEFIHGSTGADTPVELASAIGELTDGTPLLLCELWRDLLESGTVEVSHTVQVSRPLSELHGPERVGDVVRQRLSRLAPETATLLELAAVAGPRFELRVLTPASSLEGAALRAALDEATRSGILDELPEQVPAYRFTHELVRRAIYDSVTALDRAELHLRVGEALEGVHSADPARVLPELAHHFTAATPLAGVERAVDYNRRAAEAATASGALEEAAARLRTALELGISDPRERARVQLDLDYLLRETGQRAESNAVFAAGLAAAENLDDRGIVAEAVIQRLGRRLGDPQVDPDELRKEAEAAIEMFRELEDAGGLARARRRRALALHVAGRLGDACAELERALADAKASGQDARRQVVGSLAAALCQGPTPVVDAIRRCEELQAQHRSDSVLDAVVLRCLSSLYAMAGRFEEARASVERSSRFLNELDHSTHSTIYRTYAAEARELLGDRAGAEQELIERWHRRAAWDYTPDLRAMQTAYYLALLYCDDGSWDDAERCLDYGRDVLVPHSFRIESAYGLAARARVAAHRGELAEALALGRRGVELADQSDVLNLRARAWRALADVLRANEDDADADAAVAEAIRLYEAKGNVAAAAPLRAASALPT